MNTVIPKKTRTTTTPMVTSKRLPDKSISMPIFASSSNSNIQNNPKNQQQQRPGKDINHMKREVKGGKHRSGLSVRMDRKFLELTELVRNVLKITSRLACDIEENKKSLKDCNIMTVIIFSIVPCKLWFIVKLMRQKTYKTIDDDGRKQPKLKQMKKLETNLINLESEKSENGNIDEFDPVIDVPLQV